MSGSRTVARNVLVTLATQLMSWCLAFAVTIYVPRYLKPTGLGTLTLAGAFATIFSLMVGLGTSTVLVKEIARDRSRISEYLLATLAIRLPLGVLAVFVGLVASRLLGYSHYLSTMIGLSLAIMVFAQLSDTMQSILRGLEEFPRLGAMALVERTLLAVLAITLVFRHAALWMFIAAPAAGVVITLTIGIKLLFPYLRTVRPPSKDTIVRLTRAGMPFLTNAIFVAVYGQADALLLSKMSSVEAIGWYGLVQRLAGVTLVLPVALTSTMLPPLSRMHLEDPASFDRAVRRLCNLMLVLVVPFATVLILAPSQILILLHYPRSFQRSVPCLAITGGSIVLWFLSQAVGTALIASDRQGAFSKITGIAALFSVPLCALSIYITQRFYHNGAIGAVCSDTVLEIYLVISYLRVLPGRLISWDSLAIVGRAVIATLPFILLFSRIKGAGSFYLPCLGLLLYIPLCWLLRCFDPKDIQLIRDFLIRKRGNAA